MEDLTEHPSEHTHTHTHSLIANRFAGLDKPFILCSWPLVNRATKFSYLALVIDADDAAGGLVGRKDKGSEEVVEVHHANEGARLNVVEVSVAVLGDQVDDVELGGHLHGHRKVALRLERKEDVHLLLGVGLVAGGRRAHLDDVQLAAGGGAHREAEKIGRLGVALHLEEGEGGGVALKRLAHLEVLGVELHGAGDAVAL